MHQYPVQYYKLFYLNAFLARFIKFMRNTYLAFALVTLVCLSHSAVININSSAGNASSFTSYFDFTPDVNISSSLLADLTNSELTTLNELRALHGCPAVVLNSTLTGVAQSYAKTLYQSSNLVNSPGATNGSYGENLFWALDIPNYNYTEGSASLTWYNENGNYNFTTGACIDSSKGCSQFTAEIWCAVKSVGYGFYAGPQDYFGMQGTGFYAVANFHPAPNTAGAYIANVPQLVAPLV